MEYDLKHLDLAHYRELVVGADVLEADGSGDKVLRLLDGTLLKLFRRKRLLSSAAWHPYAIRFAENCAALQDRGIPCPQVKAVYRVKELSRDVVHYEPLAGETLRHVFEQGADVDTLRIRLGQFLAELHAKGVYFRSAHLNNIVLTPDLRMGLIDVADMKAFTRPLARNLRVRNFQHVLRVPTDRDHVLKDNDRIFIEAYLRCQPSPQVWQLASAIGHQAQTLGLAG